MASTAKRLGVSYSRFSDFKQAKGDSENRQDQLYRSFCERHNLTPLSEVFADRGRSGFKDEHRKKGRLGQLIALAKADRFEHGTVIVVEAWDRLGRLRPDRQTELVAELLRTGVSIGICRLDDIFSEDDFGTHKWTTLAVFIQLAYQESKQKSDRVTDSWQRRRDRARTNGDLLVARGPAWLESVGGTWRPIPERAAVVRRIFAMAAAGYGHTRIVRALEAEKVRPFGKVEIKEGRSRSQFSGKWTRPYVASILNDKRATGEFQPRTADDKADGPPLPDYYPSVVSEEEFFLARAGQEQRNNRDRNGRPLGARQGKYVNVFKGLLTHARDGEGFVLHNKGTGEKPELILVNATGNGGRGRCYTFPYPVFEEAVLRLLHEVDPREVMPKEGGVPSKADVLKAKLTNLRSDIGQLQEDLREGYSKALSAALRERETAEEQVTGELQEELARTVRPAAKAWKELPTLAKLIQTADDPDDVRLKLRPVLRRLIETAQVLMVRRGSYTVVAVQIFFFGGARRDYLIVNQAAGYRRAGGWWCRSLVTTPENGDLDLRQPEHAKRLETVLSAVDLTLE
jgi:DNA invertase Pin-like site-specific DNA recombinase